MILRLAGSFWHAAKWIELNWLASLPNSFALCCNKKGCVREFQMDFRFENCVSMIWELYANINKNHLKEQVTTNMTGPPYNIWMICITTEHKSSCDTFFLRYYKNITNFLFWERWTCLVTSIKNNNPNFRNFDCRNFELHP